MRQSEGSNGRHRQDNIAEGVKHRNVEDCPVFPEETVRYHRPENREKIGEHDEGVINNCCITFTIEEVFGEVQTENSWKGKNGKIK